MHILAQPEHFSGFSRIGVQVAGILSNALFSHEVLTLFRCSTFSQIPGTGKDTSSPEVEEKSVTKQKCSMRR
jgi:hypothetical protein